MPLLHASGGTVRVEWERDGQRGWSYTLRTDRPILVRMAAEDDGIACRSLVADGNERPLPGEPFAVESELKAVFAVG